MAEALPRENRAVSDLEGGVRLPHSDEQDPFRALRFLIPSRLEGMWGVVDGKAGGLADARHIYCEGDLKQLQLLAIIRQIALSLFQTERSYVQWAAAK